MRQQIVLRHGAGRSAATWCSTTPGTISTTRHLGIIAARGTVPRCVRRAPRRARPHGLLSAASTSPVARGLRARTHVDPHVTPPVDGPIGQEALQAEVRHARHGRRGHCSRRRGRGPGSPGRRSAHRCVRYTGARRTAPHLRRASAPRDARCIASSGRDRASPSHRGTTPARAISSCSRSCGSRRCADRVGAHPNTSSGKWGRPGRTEVGAGDGPVARLVHPHAEREAHRLYGGRVDDAVFDHRTGVAPRPRHGVEVRDVHQVGRGGRRPGWRMSRMSPEGVGST